METFPKSKCNEKWKQKKARNLQNTLKNSRNTIFKHKTKDIRLSTVMLIANFFNMTLHRTMLTAARAAATEKVLAANAKIEEKFNK